MSCMQYWIGYKHLRPPHVKFWGSSPPVPSSVSASTAAMMKAPSPIVEGLAGMANEDDAAERRCLRPGTSATRLTSADK